MNVFVLFHEEDRTEALEQAIKDKFGSDNVYPFTDNLVLVRSPAANPATFSGVGIGEDEGTGVIFKLNASHHGFYRREFWQWLKEAVDTG